MPLRKGIPSGGIVSLSVRSAKGRDVLDITVYRTVTLGAIYQTPTNDARPQVTYIFPTQRYTGHPMGGGFNTVARIAFARLSREAYAGQSLGGG